MRMVQRMRYDSLTFFTFGKQAGDLLFMMISTSTERTVDQKTEETTSMFVHDSTVKE
jgi:hypothetical protein